MKFRQIALATAALFTAAAQPVSAEWLEAKTKHFVVYGDMQEKDLREYVERMERYDAVLRKLVKANETVPVTIYVVPSMEEVRKLSGAPNVAAFYRGSYTGPLAVTPRSMGNGGDISAQQVMFHEYAHHILLSNTDQAYPGWASEGLAEFFMSAQLKPDGNVVLGAPNAGRSYAIGSMSRWTAKELLESDLRKLDRLEVEQKYSRGWLLVHYLLMSGKRNGQFAQYIDLLDSGVPVSEAATKAFGDLKKLDTELERYMRGSTFQGAELTPADYKEDKTISIRPLTSGEIAIMPLRITSANGVNEASAKRVVEKARPIGASFPQDAFVQRSLAEMEYDVKNYAATEAAADRALAVDPQNVGALAYKGRVYAMRGLSSKNKEDWATARSLFLKANKAAPDDPLPFILYYDSFKAAGDTPSANARNGLLRAITLVPQDLLVRTRVAVELVNQNDLKGARSALASVAFSAHLPPSNPLRDIVAKIDAGGTQQDVLAIIKDKKLDEVNEFIPENTQDKSKSEE